MVVERLENVKNIVYDFAIDDQRSVLCMTVEITIGHCDLAKIFRRNGAAGMPAGLADSLEHRGGYRFALEFGSDIRGHQETRLNKGGSGQDCPPHLQPIS
jgi:hypothetical protein